MPDNDTRAERFETKRLDKITNVCWGVVGVGGVVLTVGFLAVWGTGWGINLFAPGVAMGAAGLAGLVTTSGIVTWKEQRFRERERTSYSHREKEYELIVAQLIARFLDIKYDILLDSQLRARAAVWAGPSVLIALADWQQVVGSIIDAGVVDAKGKVAVSEEQRSTLKPILANVVQAMRQELETVGEITDVSRDVILRSIFND